MMKRIFSGQFQSITSAALLLGAASFLSRIVGLIRERMLAHTFGAGPELDMYTAAFRVPDFLYNILIVGALSAGFIPIFLELYTENKERAWKFTNNVFNLTAASLGILSLIAFFTLPYFLPIFLPGFSEQAQDQTIILTRIMLVSSLFLGLSAVVSNVLQSLRSFFVYSIAPIFYNFGIIAGALFFVPHFGVQGLAYGVVLGAFLHLMVQLPLFFRSGFRFSFTFSLKEKNLVYLLRLMVPRTLTLAALQMNTVVMTFFASTLASGSIAMYAFAQNIASFPIGIVGISFALAAFPVLSELFIKGDRENFQKHILTTIKQILFFIIPITILFLLLRAQIIRILLGTGAFDWDDTIQTAQTLGMLAISFFAQCLIPLLVRAFYAVKNTRTPLMVTLFSMTITIGCAWLLKDQLGVSGLALAISVGQIIQLALLWLPLQKHIGGFDIKNFLYGMLKISGAALCMGMVIQTLKYPVSLFVDMDTFWGIFVQTTIAGGMGFIIYGALSYVLRVQEMMITIKTIQKRFFKIKQIPTETQEIK